MQRVVLVTMALRGCCLRMSYEKFRRISLMYQSWVSTHLNERYFYPCNADEQLLELTLIETYKDSDTEIGTSTSSTASGFIAGMGGVIAAV